MAAYTCLDGEIGEMGCESGFVKSGLEVWCWLVVVWAMNVLCSVPRIEDMAMVQLLTV